MIFLGEHPDKIRSHPGPGKVHQMLLELSAKSELEVPPATWEHKASEQLKQTSLGAWPNAFIACQRRWLYKLIQSGQGSSELKASGTTPGITGAESPLTARLSAPFRPRVSCEHSHPTFTLH